MTNQEFENQSLEYLIDYLRWLDLNKRMCRYVCNIHYQFIEELIQAKYKQMRR